MSAMTTAGQAHLNVALRTRKLAPTGEGALDWQEVEQTERLDPASCALILCDVWDDHWCRAAVHRLERLLPRMREVVEAARRRGVLIIHAPSETMGFYEGSAARRRALAAPKVELPAERAHEDPPLPIDDSDGGCDTRHNAVAPDTRRWTRQHQAIPVDESRDVISDVGEEVYRVLCEQRRSRLFVMGVHTNMCILNRSFAIKQMVRWGVDVALVRDLTDAMYNPARSPYVSHAEGTRLVIEYIEKFWCPSALSDTFLA